MKCAKPLTAFKSPEGVVRVIKDETAVPPFGVGSERFTVACGRCINCRITKANEWAVRCAHEVRYHDASSFLTLTYDDEHVPSTGSLEKDAPTRFIKRLRNSLRGTDIKVRYFACGEYGDRNLRPHYHICLFGYDFPDKELWKEKPHNIYTSEELTGLWPYGFSTVGKLVYETAQYVAKYTLKKITGSYKDVVGSNGLRPYERMIEGVIHKVEPEFAVMSNRPGIGSRWINEFYNDAFPSDTLHYDGRSVPIPRYYRKQLEKCDPQLYETVTNNRRTKAADHFERIHRTKTIGRILDEQKEARERSERYNYASMRRKELN